LLFKIGPTSLLAGLSTVFFHSALAGRPSPPICFNIFHGRIVLSIVSVLLVIESKRGLSLSFCPFERETSSWRQRFLDNSKCRGMEHHATKTGPSLALHQGRLRCRNSGRRRRGPRRWLESSLHLRKHHEDALYEATVWPCGDAPRS